MTGNPNLATVEAGVAEVAAASRTYESAALNLAVEVDALGIAIDTFVAEQRRLLAGHVRLLTAARALCTAWADRSLDSRHVLALTDAIAASMGEDRL